MNDNYEVSSATKEAAASAPRSTKPGPILIVLTVLLMVLNVFLAFRLATFTYFRTDSYTTSQIVGYTFGAAFVLQLVVMGLFRIGARFRNWRSMLKIYCWTSVVVLLANLGNLGAAVRAVGN